MAFVGIPPYGLDTLAENTEVLVTPFVDVSWATNGQPRLLLRIVRGGIFHDTETLLTMQSLPPRHMLRQVEVDPAKKRQPLGKIKTSKTCAFIGITFDARGVMFH
jgi:hypothetical protein